MRVAGAATTRAHRQPPSQLGLRRRGESTRLLVAHVHPLDAVGAPDRVHNRIEAVAHDPVNALNPTLPKNIDQLVGSSIAASSELARW
jgi:hypothetical protein